MACLPSTVSREETINILPPIRACIFDVDGLLINSEDLLSIALNSILAEYAKPLMPWSVKSQLQGRTLRESATIIIDWAKLPLSTEDFIKKLFVLQRELFRTTTLLPGVENLLNNLARAKSKTEAAEHGPEIELALASSSQKHLYDIKTAHLAATFDLIPNEHKVLGDDPRILPGRGKPMPDIYLLALTCINQSRSEGDYIRPEECLVFEDSVAGIEAGRRAGMRVVWVPHAGLREMYRGREIEVLTGVVGQSVDSTKSVNEQSTQETSDFGEVLTSLQEFDYEKYGITIESRSFDADNFVPR